MTELAIRPAHTPMVRENDHKFLLQLDKRAPELMAFLPADAQARFMRTCIDHLRNRRDLLDQCDPASIYSAVHSAARLALEIGAQNNPGVDAYLVKFGTTCQLLVGYGGLIKLMKLSGDAVDVGATPVYEGEHYRLSMGQLVEHEGDPAKWSNPILFWYGWAKLRNGQTAIQIVPPAEMEARRIEGIKKKDSPWKSHPRQMEYKTAVRELVNRKRVMLDPAVAGVLTQLEAQYTVIEHEPRHSAIARASLHALPAGHNLPAIDHETPAAPMRDAAPDDVPVIDVTEN